MVVPVILVMEETAQVWAPPTGAPVGPVAVAVDSVVDSAAVALEEATAVAASVEEVPAVAGNHVLQ